MIIHIFVIVLGFLFFIHYVLTGTVIPSPSLWLLPRSKSKSRHQKCLEETDRLEIELGIKPRYPYSLADETLNSYFLAKQRLRDKENCKTCSSALNKGSAIHGR